MYLLNMVEVFRTNIPGVAEFEMIISKFVEHFPKSMISFDGEDCDKVVRVEAENMVINQLCRCIQSHGYECEILE